MTKPHEETWIAKLEPTFSEHDTPLWMVTDADGELVADCTAREGAARLIAQAPAMARLLLDLAGTDQLATTSRIDDRDRALIVATLHAAGVLP